MKNTKQRLSEWTRLKKINQYCDICANNNSSCTEWCNGENFKSSKYKMIKNSILDRVLNFFRKEGE